MKKSLKHYDFKLKTAHRYFCGGRPVIIRMEKTVVLFLLEKDVVKDNTHREQGG